MQPGGGQAVTRMPRSSVSGFTCDPVVCVLNGFADEAHEVPVMEGVDDVAALFAGNDEASEAQSSQMLAGPGR